MNIENKSGFDPEEARRIKSRKLADHYRLLDTLGDTERPPVFGLHVTAHKEKFGAVDFVEIEAALRENDAQLHLLAVKPPKDAKPGYALSDVNDFEKEKITPRTYAVTTRLGLPATERAALEHGEKYNAKLNLERLRDAGYFKKLPVEDPRVREERKGPHR